MTGTVTVTKTSDWLTPFEVEVRSDGGKGATARFMAAAKAQTYAVAQADLTGFTLVYRDECLDAMRVPTNGGHRNKSRQNGITPAEFCARYTRLCRKCGGMKPLDQFRGLTHRNATTGREVFHGYAVRCQGCEAEHGE